ncbi:MAG: manganese efflux pump MntP family protein [Elusimicrobiaceae bacterium]|nr:manganese efflux pump MntP family protein [Elusimicrobiaceae bacterium]
MNVLSSFIVALSLSMDNFAVAIASGCACGRNLRFKHILGVSLCFVLAHALMLSVGWFGGKELGRVIDSVDHWFAFIVLLLIGLKMVKEAFEKKEETSLCQLISLKMIFVLALATSLDALLVGMALSLTQAPYLLTLVFMMGSVLVTSYIGFYLGNYLGKRFGTWMEVSGGVSLSAVGVWVLLSGLGIC